MGETWLLPDPAMLGVVAACIAVLAVLASALMRLTVGRLTARENWRSLAVRYGTDRLPPPGCLSGRTLQVGNAQYRRCVIVGLEADGLYLAPTGRGRSTSRQPLLIPWSEFKSVEPARLNWRDAARMSVGSPTVGTLIAPRELFDKLRDRLPLGRRRAAAATGGHGARQARFYRTAGSA